MVFQAVVVVFLCEFGDGVEKIQTGRRDFSVFVFEFEFSYPNSLPQLPGVALVNRIGQNQDRMEIVPPEG